jgi:hypothetical protein
MRKMRRRQQKRKTPLQTDKNQRMIFSMPGKSTPRGSKPWKKVQAAGVAGGLRGL